MSSQLKQLVDGQKDAKTISEGAAKSALGEAVDKLKGLGNRMSVLKERGESAAEAVLTTAELQGTVFVASMAEGYWGEEKMDVGPVDIRLGLGILTGGYGIYKAMTSSNEGTHALAIGNGLVAPAIGRVGRNVGRTMREKKESSGQAPATTTTPASTPATEPTPTLPVADGDFEGLVRDVFDPQMSGRPRSKEKGGGRKEPSRFIQAHAV